MLGSALSNIYIVIIMQTLTTDLTKRRITTLRGKRGGKSVVQEVIFHSRESIESETEKSRNRSASVSFINMEVNK